MLFYLPSYSIPLYEGAEPFPLERELPFHLILTLPCKRVSQPGKDGFPLSFLSLAALLRCCFLLTLLFLEGEFFSAYFPISLFSVGDLLLPPFI